MSFSDHVHEHFEVHDFDGLEVVQNKHPHLLAEIDAVLSSFRFSKTDILAPGGGKSLIAGRLDQPLYELGWEERSFEFHLNKYGRTDKFKTHYVDCWKQGVALEIEWNNKDTFYDRDLNAFRVMYENGAIDCGVIVTRSTKLQALFKSMIPEGLSATKYVSTTTHIKQLLPKVLSGAAGDCPLVVVGITDKSLIQS